MESHWRFMGAGAPAVGIACAMKLWAYLVSQKGGVVECKGSHLRRAGGAAPRPPRGSDPWHPPVAAPSCAPPKGPFLLKIT